MKCPNCKTEIPAGSKFCPECGAPCPKKTTTQSTKKKPTKSQSVDPPVVGHCDGITTQRPTDRNQPAQEEMTKTPAETKPAPKVKLTGKADDKIIKRIGVIASLLHKNRQQYTRADLAYDLQNYGVKRDSNILDNWVYVAYQTKPFPKEVFLTNDHKHYMIDAYELHAVLSTQDDEQATMVVQQHLQKTQAKINSTQRQASQKISNELADTSSLLSTIKGTGGIDNVRKEADTVFGKYTKLVDTYHEAHFGVDMVVSDFVELRAKTQELFLTYSSALIDIFGDSITVISPHLFDFSQIQWLDVDAMLGNVQLEYDKITATCEMLLSEISDSFKNTLNSASQTLQQKKNDKTIAVMQAGMAVFEHYADAAQKTAVMKKELLKLKQSMRHDATVIKGDIMRAAVIYRTLNEVYIPKALWYNRFSTDTLEQQLNVLTAEIYALPEIKPLKEQRDKLISSVKNISRSIFDVQNSIDYYTKHIAESKKTLKKEIEHYQTAKRNKPEKPFLIFNLLTLGGLGRSYRRKLHEWSLSEMPFVEAYEALQADVNIEQEDLKSSQQQLKLYQQKYDILRGELETTSRTIRAHLQTDKSLQARVATHLTDYIRLLFVAKEIGESRLNDDLVQTVSIEKIEDVALPAEITQNINSFVDTIADKIHISSSGVADILSSVSPNIPKPQPIGNAQNSQETPQPAHSAEDLQAVAAQANHAIQHGAELCKQLLELRAMEEQDEQNEAYYQQRLGELQDKFRAQMQSTDDASQAILQIAMQLNSTEDADTIRQALIDLSGEQNPYSEQDIQDFLAGKRTIKI